MTQHRLICLCLAIKGLAAQTMHSDLVAVTGTDAIAYQAVTCMSASSNSSHFMTTAQAKWATGIDNAILDALEKQPFSAIQDLTQPSRTRTTT
jgi:hypothetical protein